MDVFELEPQLKAMLGEVERGGVAFKVGRGLRQSCSKVATFCVVLVAS